MTSYLALLRGVNVGGTKVAMAELRSALEQAGFAGVRSYIQSGNVFVESDARVEAVAHKVSTVISDEFGLTIDVIVFTKAAFEMVVNKNPYASAADKAPTTVHVVCFADAVNAAVKKRVEAAVERAGERGSSDEAKVAGRAIYLHTPDGFGRSALAAELTKGGKPSPMKLGTARNWKTMGKLAAMWG